MNPFDDNPMMMLLFMRSSLCVSSLEMVFILLILDYSYTTYSNINTNNTIALVLQAFEFYIFKCKLSSTSSRSHVALCLYGQEFLSTEHNSIV